MQEQHAQSINPWIIALSVMLPTFMQVLDSTVLNVSLPHIAGNLSATTDQSTWVATSYLVSNGIVLPMTGWLANQFGRKRLLMLSIAGFTLSSFLCGMAPNLASLIVFRVIQGFTGGGLQPLSQAIMLEVFPLEKRGKAMGFWSMGTVVAPMLGPVLGGWITDNYSWRWIFYINLPLGIAALIMCKMFVFDPHYIRRKAQRIDYWGLSLLTIAVASLQITLDKGQEEDWFSSNFIVVLTAVAIVGFLLFVIRELLTDHPILDLRVLKDRTFTVGLIVMLMTGIVIYANMVLFPVYLQTLLGYPAVQAGLAMVPRGLGSFLFMPIVGAITGRVAARKLLAFGVVLGTYALWLFGSINLDVGFRELILPNFLWGVSSAFVAVPLTVIAFNSILPKDMGNATSVAGLIRNVGGGVGISSVAAMVTRMAQGNISQLGAHFTPHDSVTQQVFGGMRQMFISHGVDFTTAGKQAYAVLFGMVQRQAAMLSFVQTFRLLTFFFAATLPLILLMRRPQHRTKQVAVE